MRRLLSLALAVIMVLCLFTVSVSAASISLPDLISDHMLLQQGKEIKLWGKAGAGVAVLAELREGKLVITSGTGVADDKGNFEIVMPPVPAGGPYTLAFSENGEVTARVSDVLVGELWVQSGQSNMVKTTGSLTEKRANEILPEGEMDEIRIFMNGGLDSNAERRTDLVGEWEIASAATVAEYSAVGYAALEEMYNTLKVPVGGICAGAGGTGMGGLMGPETRGGVGGSTYNTKIAPLTQFSVRGVMWYQGEYDRNNENYVSDFKKLITSYRTDFNNATMPFILVMLPGSPMKMYAEYTGGYSIQDYSHAKLSQLEVFNTVPNVGISITTDCPPDEGDDPVHPSNKYHVGKRLGTSALGLVYGVTDKWSSPNYMSAKANGSEVTVTFSHAYDGLKTTDGEAPKAFMVAGEDGKFYEAKAEITGKDTVKLTSSKVSDIKQISYAVDQDIFPYTSIDDAVEQKYVEVNLVNSIDLPAAPFRFEVTKTVPAKTPIYANEQIFKNNVAVGASYSLPPTVELTKYDGTTERQRVTWTEKQVDTSKAGTVEIIGYPIKCDIPVIAKITVGDVEPTVEDVLNENGIVLKLDYPNAIIKGKTTQIDTNNSDVTPMLVNDRTMVPVRFIAEGYKAKVGWDDPTQTVTIELGGKTIKMVINALTYTVDGVEKTLDVPAQLINERTMVPVRVISEAFNKTVFWDGDRNLIVVYEGKTLDVAKETALLNKLDSKIAY